MGTVVTCSADSADGADVRTAEKSKTENNIPCLGHWPNKVVSYTLP